MTNLDGVVQLLKKEHARLTSQIQGVSAALAALGASYKNGSGTLTRGFASIRMLTSLPAVSAKQFAAVLQKQKISTQQALLFNHC